MRTWLVPLRVGDNEELRYAIRSWVRFAGMKDGDRLVSVGDKPSWFHPDEHVEGNPSRSSPVNVFWNIREATACMSGEVIVMNDDFFATAPTDPTRLVFRGSLDAHIRMLRRPSWWRRSLEHTRDYLKGVGVVDPVSWERHAPITVDAQRIHTCLSTAWDGVRNPPPQWRTLYGNLHLFGEGVLEPVDGKLFTARTPARGVWVSTTDTVWGSSPVAAGFRSLFDTPTRWEG